MQINAIAPWFGGKRRLAAEIVRELGNHSAYWEPFCGSMAVLLAKTSAPMETVNDLNGDLINLARVIQHPIEGPRLYRRLRRTLAAHAIMDDCAERWKESGRCPVGDKPDGDRAYDYFVSSWLGRNGVSGTTSFNQGYSRRFTKSGGHAAKRWASAVDSIPAWRRRMRQVSILGECGIGIIERIEDAAGVAIYIDPPYVEKGAKYVHDFVYEDHVRLAAALNRFQRTRVVVSYYDHPIVRELYNGWTIRPLKATKSMANQGRRDRVGSTAAPELLLVNGQSHVDVPDRGLFSVDTSHGS